MIRRFSKLLRVAGILFMVALLSLSGELNILGLEIGSSMPTAKAAQTAMARPKMKFREVDGQFLVVGENGALPGILVENALGGAACYQTIIGTQTATSQKARLAMDSAGNVYVVWQEAPPNSGFQVFLAVLDANCIQVPGSPFAVSSLLSSTYGISSAAGTPDIAYSPSENRVYMTFQGPGPNGQVLAFSGVAGTSGWNSGGRWDRIWGLTNAQTAAYPRIAVAPADGTGNVRAHIIFKSNNGTNGSLRAVDLSGGANGSWNQYTNGLGQDISNNPNNNVPDGSQEIGNSNDGSTYATYFSPGPGPLSVGMNKFDPNAGAWGTGRDNVVGNNGSEYSKLVSSGLGVGHTSGVYIGLGVPSYVLTYASADKGATFPANQHRNFGPYSGDMVAVTIAEGNNTVVVYSLDGVRVNHANTFTGVEAPPIITTIDSPANGSVISAPSGQNFTSFTLNWHKVSGGTGAALTYYVDYWDSTSPGWVPLITTTATSFTNTYYANRSYMFRVRGVETSTGIQETPHANADISVTVKYGLFTGLDMGIDATGYFAPSGTVDNNTPAGTELAYFALPQPIRILDTRAGAAVGLYRPNAPLTGGTPSNFKVAGSGVTLGGISIPPEAKALAANTTVIFPGSPGFITVYPGPTGSARPTTATMNYNPNVLLSNATSLTVGADGTINIFSSATVDVGIDIMGYYAPINTPNPNGANPGLVYHPLSKPIRVLDTRPGQTALYAPGAPLPANSPANYKMAGSNVTVGGVNIPSTAQAVVGSVSVIYPSVSAYLTVYPGPTNSTRPTAASMTYNASSLLGNNALMTLGADSTINLYSPISIDVAIDIVGYYAPQDNTNPGLLYYPLPKPTRLLDTRSGATGYYHPGAPVQASSSGVTNFVQNYQLNNLTNPTDNINIPAAAQAVDCIITTITPNYSSGSGYLTAYPGPSDSTGANRPLATTMLYTNNQVLSIGSFQTLGSDGTINLFNATF